MTSRRRWLQRVAGLAGSVGLAGCTSLSTSTAGGQFGLEPNPNDLPERQHAQNAFLRRDSAGNPIVPRHHAVLLLDLDDDPSAAAARTVEGAMRAIESAYEWGPSGLFHMLVWGHPYFERIGRADAAPIGPPTNESRIDEPQLEGFDAALVLSTDVPSHLGRTEAAMFGGAPALEGVEVNDRLGDVFSVAGRRTGFIGEGLPQKHADAEGIPTGVEIPESSPMFMGFRSGLKSTQASEDAVTISGGPLGGLLGGGEFAGGTTMNLTHFQQSLSGWYEGLDQAEQVDRMFSPEFSPGAVEGFADAVPFADNVREHAADFDVVGHHEKVAQARKNGKPLLLRRDFNTADGGQAGVHFISLQASIDDFVKTRRAMNGWYVRDDSSEITDQVNNGILEFITEVAVANFYVPPRPNRAFPGFRP
jgi:hypothetical protein